MRWVWATVTGLALALVTSVATVLVLGRMWGDCEVGGAGSGLSLLFIYGPVIWFGTAVVAAGTFLAVDWRLPRAVAMLAAVVAAIGIAWISIAHVHNPGGDYPSTSASCDDENVPDWWPDLIPI